MSASGLRTNQFPRVRRRARDSYQEVWQLSECSTWTRQKPSWCGWHIGLTYLQGRAFQKVSSTTPVPFSPVDRVKLCISPCFLFHFGIALVCDPSYLIRQALSM